MILLQSNTPQPQSFLSKALEYLIPVLKNSPQNQPKTVIDLSGPNQAVREFRNGLTPLFCQTRSSQMKVRKIRNSLLKKRYLQILEEQNIVKQAQKQKNKLIIPQMSQLSSIQTFQKGLTAINTMILTKDYSKIFEEGYFAENIDKNNANLQSRGEKQGHKQQPDFKKELINSQSQIFAKDSDQKCWEKKYFYRQDSRKDVSIRVQQEYRANQQTPSKQNNQKIEPSNPFLCSTTKKLSFSSLISKIQQKDNIKYESNNEELTKTKKIQNFQSETFYNNCQQQNNNLFQGFSLQSSQTFPIQGNFNMTNSNSNHMNTNLNMFNNVSPLQSLNSQTFGSFENQQKSVAMFLSPSQQTNQNLLYGASSFEPANNPSKERTKKKKCTKVRVYQQ